MMMASEPMMDANDNEPRDNREDVVGSTARLLLTKELNYKMTLWQMAEEYMNIYTCMSMYHYIL